jgi:hypothetical protein
MNERLVFFCDRDQRPCYLYRWGATEGSSSYLYQVYCRSALDTAPPGQPGQRIDLAVLADQVAAAGGGLVAETRQSGDLVVLRVQTVPAVGYEPAHGMVMLAPGQEPKPMPIDGRGITLATGELVLVPATGDDEANLAILIEHLKRLPGDYRGLILDVLRQPGLDGAMRRLTLRINELMERFGETSGEVPEASGRGSQRGGPLTPGTDTTDPSRTRKATPKVRMGGFWPWLLAGLLILNLAGLAASVRLLLPGATAQQIQHGSVTPRPPGRQPPPQGNPAEATAVADFEARGEPSPSQQIRDKRFEELAGRLKDCESKIAQAPATGASPAGQANDPKQAVNDLIEAWMIQAYAWPTKDPRRIVAEAHFSDGKGTAVYDTSWLTGENGDDKAASVKRQERLTYALAKLMLIENGIEVPRDIETLKDPDARTNTKKAILTGLTAKDGNPRLNDDDRQFLAWLACRVFPQDDPENNAQILRIGDDDPAGNDVDLRLACNHVDDCKVLAAIRFYRDALTLITQ